MKTMKKDVPIVRSTRKTISRNTQTGKIYSHFKNSSLHIRINLYLSPALKNSLMNGMIFVYLQIEPVSSTGFPTYHLNIF